MSKPPAKEYGLILPNKSQKPSGSGPVLKKPSIFESDSDSDESAARPTGISVGLKRQDKEIQNKAMEEDPTIYQYDELYDEMDQKRKDSKLSRKDLDKKPKYISNLLKAAEKRKLENERRIERQVQREREAEGNEFKDKEQFVTAAYKKKLEEMREQEELEKREEYLEAIGDVTKQGNLDGFYRHLYEQKVNYDEEKEKKMEEIKNAVKTEDSDTLESDVSDDTDDKEAKEDKDKESSSTKAETAENTDTKKTSERKRQYRRKRSHSRSDESEEEINTAHSHLPSNLDADSDFSIDSESDSDSNSDDDAEPKTKVAKKETETQPGDAEKNGECSEKTNGFSTHEKLQNGDAKPEIEEKKPRIDIWKKRTVGAIFDAALQRYYARKSLRSSA